MAISYKKNDRLENLFANFAKLPDNMDSDPNNKGDKTRSTEKQDKKSNRDSES